nr:hypothetical protein Iba_chr02eCG7710 [Ipomoea batatas]
MPSSTAAALPRRKQRRSLRGLPHQCHYLAVGFSFASPTFGAALPTQPIIARSSPENKAHSSLDCLRDLRAATPTLGAALHRRRDEGHRDDGGRRPHRSFLHSSFVGRSHSCVVRRRVQPRKRGGRDGSRLAGLDYSPLG